MHTWTWAEGAFVGAHAREASGDAASAGAAHEARSDEAAGDAR